MTWAISAHTARVKINCNYIENFRLGGKYCLRRDLGNHSQFSCKMRLFQRISVSPVLKTICLKCRVPLYTQVKLMTCLTPFSQIKRIWGSVSQNKNIFLLSWIVFFLRANVFIIQNISNFRIFWNRKEYCSLVHSTTKKCKDKIIFQNSVCFSWVR